MTTTVDDHDSRQAVLQVLRGNPTDEEVAAVLVVLMALGSGQDVERASSSEGWGGPGRVLRQLAPGNRVAHPWRRG